jgi:hypothetical protein
VIRLLGFLAVVLVFAKPAAGEELSSSEWHYGAALDLSYALDFNFPENHFWRNKTTSRRVNELAPNVAVGYVRKAVSPASRWGMELGVQGGYDTEALVPAAVAGGDRPVGSADTLRHFSRANVSYLAPVGNGLALTAGLFNSYIGYQSFYAKNNLNYTRSYMADNAPYFMFGVGAVYPLHDSLQIGLYVLNGYNYLSRANDHPSYGTQVQWRPTARLTVTENVYYGPDQSNTAIEFWRFFSDSIIEWKGGPLTLAAAYDIGTENAAEHPAHSRTFWTGGALYAHWNVSAPWSVALRPEFYWDRTGRISGSEQLLKALTATLAYKWTPSWLTALWQLEYRYDESTGQNGGFFARGERAPGLPSLTREQHLLLCSVVWWFDR